MTQQQPKSYAQQLVEVAALYAQHGIALPVLTVPRKRLERI